MFFLFLVLKYVTIKNGGRFFTVFLYNALETIDKSLSSNFYQFDLIKADFFKCSLGTNNFKF
jgi:hypothetical protein